MRKIPKISVYFDTSGSMRGHKKGMRKAIFSFMQHLKKRRGYTKVSAFHYGSRLHTLYKNSNAQDIKTERVVDSYMADEAQNYISLVLDSAIDNTEEDQLHIVFIFTDGDVDCNNSLARKVLAKENIKIIYVAPDCEQSKHMVNQLKIDDYIYIKFGREESTAKNLMNSLEISWIRCDELMIEDDIGKKLSKKKINTRFLERFKNYG